MKCRSATWVGRGFSLIELLCVIAIIAILAALLLPTLSRGKLQVQRIACISNLQQMGVTFLNFAHGHEDKYPIQVSTNQGGSSEFLLAGQAINGEFYFSYRHFLPLARDLHFPKLLVCPSDTQRNAATNFETLRNENLSYFVGANPQYVSHDSVLAGDRNVSPVFGTTTQVGGYRYLKWTQEMHQYKGNVLFADGHVETLKDMLTVSNTPGGVPATLIMPTVKAPVDQSQAGPANQVSGANRAGTLPLPNNPKQATVSVSSNAVVSGAVTNIISIRSGPPGNPPVGFLAGPAEAGAQPGPPEPGVQAKPVLLEGPIGPNVKNPPPTQPAPGVVPQPAGPVAAQPVARFKVPWWIVALVLLVVVEVIRRCVRVRRVVVEKRPDRGQDELLPH